MEQLLTAVIVAPFVITMVGFAVAIAFAPAVPNEIAPATGHDHIDAEETAADHSLMLKIDPPKIIDLIISKQTQYYTLWGVYTAVQFAAGSFGYSSPLPLGVGLAVLFGVWAFNLGHLGFVLQCVDQLNKLSVVMNAALKGDNNKYQSSLLDAFKGMQEGILFWKLFTRGNHLRSYRMNSFVHFFIDSCASVALLIRVDNPWIQNHVPSLLKASSRMALSHC
jgi:hypothetical protein